MSFDALNTDQPPSFWDDTVSLLIVAVLVCLTTQLKPILVASTHLLSLAATLETYSLPYLYSIYSPSLGDVS